MSDQIEVMYAQLLAAGTLSEGATVADVPHGVRKAAFPAADTRADRSATARNAQQREAYPVSAGAALALPLSDVTSKTDAERMQPTLVSELGREAAVRVAVEEVLYVAAEPTEGTLEMCLSSELARSCARAVATEQADSVERELPMSDAEAWQLLKREWNGMAHSARVPRGFKSVEHLEVIRQSDPCYGSLAPRIDRPGMQEYSYDPMARWSAMAKHLRTPRGAKSVEHLEILRQSDPCYGSLMPRADRPSAHEHTYEPMARWSAMTRNVRVARGFKSVEHLEILRQSDPCYGTLMPHVDRPSAHEHTYEPLARWAAMNATVRVARGFKSAEHLEILRQSDPCYGTTAPSLDRPAAHEISFDPIARWIALGRHVREPRGAKSVQHLHNLRLSNPCYGSLMPRADRPAVHEHSYDPLVRWAAMSCILRAPRGAKSVQHLTTLRLSDPCYGSLVPRVDRPSAHEHTYEPLARWAAMASIVKEPRGSKSVEHLEVLRQSDPCYGSLMPALDRPGPHEYSYEPLVRWVTMATHLRLPRGSKSVEHLENLRQSDPCYGTLAPAADHPAAHEYSYEPLTRWGVVAHTVPHTRGSKSVEHVKALRLSDPSYGSLAPSMDRPGPHEHTYDPMGRWNAMAPMLREPRGAKTVEHLESLRYGSPALAALARVASEREEEAEDGWQHLSTSAMPRVLSTHSFYDDDELPELPAQWMIRRKVSSMDGYGSDNESERSAARTLERLSNDTVNSFLDDSWPPSPKLDPAEGHPRKPGPVFQLPAPRISPSYQ